MEAFCLWKTASKPLENPTKGEVKRILKGEDAANIYAGIYERC
jgi:hypothetical protein